MVCIEELNIYPLKSARRIAKSAVRVCETGFEWDRHWMVTDAGGKFLTQRTHPQLARIVPEISGAALCLHAPECAPLEVPLGATGAPIAVQVWQDRCEGLDQGDVAGAWVSAIVAQPARLVRVPRNPGRRANPQFAAPQPAPVAFPDGYPLLVCNRASLDELNARMPEPIPMERFRPNIVLGGLPPYAEDRIAALEIGAVRLRLVKPSTRCIITATDQSTGMRSTDPLPVLRQFRFDRALSGVTFGENAVVAHGVGALLERGAQCAVVYEP